MFSFNSTVYQKRMVSFYCKNFRGVAKIYTYCILRGHFSNYVPKNDLKKHLKTIRIKWEQFKHIYGFSQDLGKFVPTLHRMKQ